ncbi:MAG: NAD(P)-binding protein, partial [Pseudomonadota bacterium]|nr:NAD(P)-binding protein [Pseudomonadota bacterium]
MNKNLKIAVLGAGMSGMAMGHSLIKAGFTNFTIYEKADRV